MRRYALAGPQQRRDAGPVDGGGHDDEAEVGAERRGIERQR
jgi:hypothetical protein